jgi:replicative DNA helicase
MPGDMMAVLADPGAGKTTALLNIAYSQRPLPCVFFQLELSPEAMVERFVARDLQHDTLAVETDVRAGREFDTSGWSNVYLCPESKLTPAEMESIVDRAELKIGRRPAFVLVDYIGLMDGPSGKRYERVSAIAEDLKRLARSTNTVVIIASQVSRDKDRTEISLHDGRDSGSIEASAQLVLGAWRPTVDRMQIRVLKQTRRAGSHDLYCRYDGNKQTIQELVDGEK